MLVDLQGQIERVTYANEETGYTIARVKIEGQRDLVTVVGNLLAANPGEIIRMRGEWTNHPKYGEQFRIVHCQTVIPATVHGIQKYLGSGLIKGIGPVMARRIVQRFGNETLEVIEKEVGRLAEVDGIGLKRIEMIRRAWEEQKEIREVMIFLQAHGVSSAFAAKIFKYYGSRSIEVVRENPYRLATDIYGIGFVTADRIAEKLGVAKDADMRVEAGILYVLQQLSEEGHVYYPYEPLIEKSREMLGVERDVLVKAIGAIALEKRIVMEDLNEELERFAENHKAVYLTSFHISESGIASRLRDLIHAPGSIRPVDAQKAVDWVQGRLSITLAAKQVEAVRWATQHKLMIITGGPGTGKTTIIHAILQIYSKLGIRILLAAPTGRAAKRMSEATGHEARTIHRLLEYSIQKGGFQRNEQRPLECHLLIVDEASMIDTLLMYHLVKAVPPGATLLLVGDVNQLPSVGPGNVLGDLIDSGAFPVVELNEIFRQAEESLIIVNAHRINQGVMPALRPSGRGLEDFYFIEQEDPGEVLKIIVDLVKDRIPRRFGLDPVEDIQVLTPMHRGSVGVANLNTELQQVLNPSEGGLTRGSRTFRVNDKVMQVRNNYDKEVFNGDIGRIKRINQEDQEVLVSIDGREIPYDYADLDELILAYAVSVHKSQGSEYPGVIIPLLTQHYLLLQRNLLYTAVTRGRRLVVLVGSRKALAIAVNNVKTQKRYTYLACRLKSPAGL
ncbi:MAG: ATP-dependent RecD-like DNA helicase [Thermodesulfobacteriota bacterium]